MAVLPGARKPNLTFLEPGLRLPKAGEAVANPFMSVQHDDRSEIVPALVLCGEQTTKDD